jgi:mono/diheme cytochrome c family protein
MTMRHRHSPLAIVAALAALSALAPAANADEGEAAFKARCGDCHGPREFPRWAKQRPDAAQRSAWLDQFLRKHYPPPEKERALIVGYIERTIAGGK